MASIRVNGADVNGLFKQVGSGIVVSAQPATVPELFRVRTPGPAGVVKLLGPPNVGDVDEFVPRVLRGHLHRQRQRGK
jgi:hypothetical protein